ncbi:MAG: hypothetical protein WD942_11120 [Dehalococcoidia bacterium]
MTSVNVRDANPLASLSELLDREQELAQAKRDLVAQARSQGRSWSEIGAAFGVTKQAAWELYNAEITSLLDRVAERSNLDDETASAVAQDELEEVRRRRGSRGTA